MTTYNIPYKLCKKLDLLINVTREHKKLIKDDSILEDVIINSKCKNGWMVDMDYTFKILNTTYTETVYYNTSSPYALYICELEDYNHRDTEEE